MRVAVVGAGRWGGLHAAKLASLPGVTVAAVVDPDADRARAVAAAVGAVALPDLDHLPPIDAASVAVPIGRLAEVSGALLRLGLPVLAEKPLARDVAEAEAVLATAQRHGGRLAVGFVERFNPAVPDGARRCWLARRVGPHAPSEDLALDWLVHDLDLACWRLGALRAVAARADAAGVWWRGVSAAGVGVRLHAGVASVARRRLRTDEGRTDLRGAADALGAELAAFVAWVGGAVPDRLALGADAVACLRLLREVGLGA